MEYLDGKMVHVYDQIIYKPYGIPEVESVVCVVTAVWNNKKLYVLSIDDLKERGWVRRYIVEDMSHVIFVQHLTEEAYYACIRDAEESFKK